MLEPTGVNLNHEERIIFEEIIDEREPGHWSEHHVRLAALLAREIHAISNGQSALTQHGHVARNGQGTLCVHPTARAVNEGVQRVCAFRRSIGISARALGGEKRDIGRRRIISLQQERSAFRDSDNLIAYPNSGGRDDA